MPEPSRAPKAPATRQRSSAGAEDLLSRAEQQELQAARFLPRSAPAGRAEPSSPSWCKCCRLLRDRGLPPGRPRPRGSTASSWKASLCQATISARNDIPRGGSGSAKLPAGPPPPPLPFPLWPLRQPPVWPAQPVLFTLAPVGAQPAQQAARATCPQRVEGTKQAGADRARGATGLSTCCPSRGEGLGSPLATLAQTPAPAAALVSLQHWDSKRLVITGLMPPHQWGPPGLAPRLTVEQKQRLLPHGLTGGCARPWGSCLCTGCGGCRGV